MDSYLRVPVHGYRSDVDRRVGVLLEVLRESLHRLNARSTITNGRAALNKSYQLGRRRFPVLDLLVKRFAHDGETIPKLGLHDKRRVRLAQFLCVRQRQCGCSVTQGEPTIV
jgi:hypothetical protein